MLDENNRRLRQLDTLIEMTRLINSTLDTHLVREKSIAAIMQLMDSEAASMLLLDAGTNELYFEVALGEKHNEIQSIRIEAGKGIAGHVARTGIPLIVKDAQKDDRFYPGVDETSGFKTRDILCVPIISKEQTLGVLQAINRREGEFGEEDEIILHALANQVAVAIENAALYRDSISDGLTGIYQRRYLDLRLKEEMHTAKRYQHPLSIMMLDVDHFKQVNDRYGHTSGDEVLKKVAAVMKQGTRMSDVVGRYGGEEFMIIVPFIAQRDVESLAERIRRAIAASDINGIKVTISIGVAHFDGRPGKVEYDRLLELADNALYEAKTSGRNKVAVRLPR
ncbi:MAG: sensor domain-containing diguanylate cyclase [Gammaproteobacteria bacterium]|jgi:diguanylate cyclase (GGDEF)-like protein|nr:MAG: sensor domain-containing diguanylate cyclase [Gammaproteobacteria bacterium]